MKPDTVKSDNYDNEETEDEESLGDILAKKPRASGGKSNNDEEALVNKATANGTPLGYQPQYLQYKWDGTSSNDDDKTVTYLSVLISLPSGLIRGKKANVNLKGKVLLTINKEGTFLYVQTNWPKAMYNSKLIQSAQRIIFSSDNMEITESNLTNVMLAKMAAVKELVAMRELLAITDDDPINTTAKIPLKFTCIPDIKHQTSVVDEETAGVFLLVNLLVADSIKQSRSSNCTKHASV
jgi:hypothetical protein